jgi:hypothetical protein
MKIRLTKMKIVADNRFPPTSRGQSLAGETWEGEQSPITPEPMIGRPFFISTYKTSFVQKILSANTFETLNSIYKWEKII